MSDTPSPAAESELDFLKDLAKTEQTLAQLKQRYQQIQDARQQQEQIENKQQQIQQEWEKTQLSELHSQLERLQEQLDELKIILESELLSSQQSRQLFFEAIRQVFLAGLFWQIVRFGGIGVLVGWLLKAWAG